MVKRVSKPYTPTEHYSRLASSYARSYPSCSLGINGYVNCCGGNEFAIGQMLGGMLTKFTGMALSCVSTSGGGSSKAVSKKEEVVEEKPADILKDLVSDYDTLPEKTQKALLERYNKLIEKNDDNYDKALIKLNLNNYLKGLNARGIEQKFGLSDKLCSEEIVISGVDEAIKKGDTKAYLDAYRTAAQEFIAQYDTDGDGKINLDELKENGIDLTDSADRDEFAIAFLETINRDSDKSTLDVNEVAAYLLSMARINDYDNGKEIAKTGSSINQSEYASTLDIILSNTTTIKEYESTLETKMKEILLKANIEFPQFIALDDLSTLTGISDDEKAILQDYKENNLLNLSKRGILEGRLKTNYDIFSAN